MRASLAAVARMVAIVTILTCGTAFAQHTRVKVYDTIDSWRILAVWSKKNAMSLTCSAYYKLDERLGHLFAVTFSKESNGEWRIEFRRESWPQLTEAVRKATLVDMGTNQKISNRSPNYGSRSVTFPIGIETDEIEKFKRKKHLHVALKSPTINTTVRLPRTHSVIDRINDCQSHFTN